MIFAGVGIALRRAKKRAAIAAVTEVSPPGLTTVSPATRSLPEPVA
jgi:hypothetical protein